MVMIKRRLTQYLVRSKSLQIWESQTFDVSIGDITRKKDWKHKDKAQSSWGNQKYWTLKICNWNKNKFPEKQEQEFTKMW